MTLFLVTLYSEVNIIIIPKPVRNPSLQYSNSFSFKLYFPMVDLGKWMYAELTLDGKHSYDNRVLSKCILKI